MRDMSLSPYDEACLGGELGEAPRMAMELVAAYGRIVGATELLDIEGAHVDGCLDNGQVSLDFITRFVDAGGKVRVPTSLNVGTIDLIHPELYRGPAKTRDRAEAIMRGHVALGCTPSFTCAPYQAGIRPRLGSQVVWAESNAITFANSVLGARTERYGDFIDVACAITGRAPAYGLHLEENRHAEIVYEIIGLPHGWGQDERLPVAIGAIIGLTSTGRVPAIVGLPDTLGEDDLKALGATAAATGSVALYHAVGLTPEAPSLPTALGGTQPGETIRVDPAMLEAALRRFTRKHDDEKLRAVVLGTPHFSETEFDRLLGALDGFAAAPDVDLYINTSRAVHNRLDQDGRLARVEAAGFRILTDTCVYATTALPSGDGVIMTNSGKMAHYGPGNLGAPVSFGTLADCLASAVAGRVVRASS